MSAMTTVAPAAARRRAIASPIPVAAPVTTAVWFLREKNSMDKVRFLMWVAERGRPPALSYREGRGPEVERRLQPFKDFGGQAANPLAELRPVEGGHLMAY